MPSGYAWEQKALCVLAEAYLCLFSFWLTVPASIHAVNVFSLEKHNRAAWIWEVSRNLIPIWWCKSCGTCAFTWKLTVVWAVTFSQRVHASSYLPLGMSGLLFCLSIILHLFPPFFLYHLLFCLSVLYIKAIQGLFHAIQKYFPTKMMKLQ